MNMKTYLPSTTLLILFLLLVDKPVSPLPLGLLKPAIQLGKEGLKVIGGIAIEKGLNNLKNQHQNNPPPPPPPAPEEQKSPPSTQQPEVVIQGLSSVKSYLYNYGYLRSQSYPPSFITDTLDDDTKQAITNYQSAFKLQTTGFPDVAIIDKMLQPRCSVPDLNYRYTLDDGTNQVLSWPKGTNWSSNPSNLTYAIDVSISEQFDNANDDVADFFNSWSQVDTQVSLTEAIDGDEYPQIWIMSSSFFNNRQIGGIEVAGNTIIQRGPQSSDNNNVAFIIFENETSLEGLVNWDNVAMHQIGHILGLEHSHDEDSIMHPVFISLQQTKEISDTDMKQIS